MSDSPNLYQRLLAIQDDLKPIPPTGKDQYGNPSLSIEDVEAALLPLLTKHRVTTCPHDVGIADIGNGKLWQRTLRIEFVNADQPDQRIALDWSDIGANPSSAASFARKSLYKAMFHIVEKTSGQAFNNPPAHRQEPGTYHGPTTSNSAPANEVNPEQALKADLVNRIRAACLTVTAGEKEGALTMLSDLKQKHGVPGVPGEEMPVSTLQAILADAQEQAAQATQEAQPV